MTIIIYSAIFVLSITHKHTAMQTITEFLTATEKMQEDTRKLVLVSQIGEKVMAENLEYSELANWPPRWHKEAIQEAKAMMDDDFISYPE